MTDKFDPRFDPRFQPGYAPGPNAPKPDEVPRPDRAGRHQKTVAPTAAEVVDDTAALEAELDEPVVAPEPNPLERILLVIGAVLVAGGVAVAFWANSLNFQYTSFGNGLSWQQLLQSAAWSLSAPMVTVGLAIGVGVLFRRAFSWKPPE